MAKEKNFGKFLIYCSLLLLLFLILVPLLSLFRGKLFKLEMAVFLLMVLLSFIGFVGCHKNWGERVLFFVFLVNLGNLLLIWWLAGKLFMLPLLLGMVGFLMGFPRKSCRSRCCQPEVYKELPETKVEIIEEEPKVKTTFIPGKYIASNRGSVYHVPTCDWAKKIVEDRRVWFKDKKEAGRKHYKPHGCVE